MSFTDTYLYSLLPDNDTHQQAELGYIQLIHANLQKKSDITIKYPQLITLKKNISRALGQKNAPCIARRVFFDYLFR